MSTVVMHAVASIDGYIADENDDVGPLFDWYFNGDQPIVEESVEQQHAPFRVSSTSLPYVRSFWTSVRVAIQGRHGQHLLENPDIVIRGDRVLHLRFMVRR